MTSVLSKIQRYISHLRYIFISVPVSKATLLHERLKTPLQDDDDLTPYGVFLETVITFGSYGVALTYIAWWMRGFGLSLPGRILTDVLAYALICFVILAYTSRFRRK